MVTWTYSELFFFSFVSSTLWPAFRFLSFTREPCKRGGKNLTNKIILGEKKKKRQIKLLGFQRLLTKNICWTSWIFLRPWETHPRISNFFPNHQVGLAGLSQLTAPSDSCSVLPFFFFFLEIHYLLVYSIDTYACCCSEGRERSREEVYGEEVSKLNLVCREGLVLLKGIKPAHCSMTHIF